MPNEILTTTIIVQFIKIWDKNSNYINETYNIFDNKIRYLFDIYYIITIKQCYTMLCFLQFYQVKSRITLFVTLIKILYLLKCISR